MATEPNLRAAFGKLASTDVGAQEVPNPALAMQATPPMQGGPAPQETPKPSPQGVGAGVPQDVVAPPALSPVQQAVIDTTQAEAAKPTELHPIGQALVDLGFFPNAKPVKAFEEPQPAVLDLPSALPSSTAMGQIEAAGKYFRDTAVAIPAGIEGMLRATANFFPGFQEKLRKGRDENGQPLRQFSTDPRDFVFAPHTTYGSIATDLTVAAANSYALGLVGTAAAGVQGLGKAGTVIRAAGKSISPEMASTKLGKLLSFANANGLENVLQLYWETRKDAVPDVQSWARLFGIESDLPEILQKGGDLNSLQQKVVDNLSVYAAGAVGGTAASGVLLGTASLAKMGLGLLGKHIDDLIEIYGPKMLDKNTGQLVPVPVSVKAHDYDNQIAESFDDLSTEILAMSDAGDLRPAKGQAGPPPGPLFRFKQEELAPASKETPIPAYLEGKTPVKVIGYDAETDRVTIVTGENEPTTVERRALAWERPKAATAAPKTTEELMNTVAAKTEEVQAASLDPAAAPEVKPDPVIKVDNLPVPTAEEAKKLVDSFLPEDRKRLIITGAADPVAANLKAQEEFEKIVKKTMESNSPNNVQQRQAAAIAFLDQFRKLWDKYSDQLKTKSTTKGFIAEDIMTELGKLGLPQFIRSNMDDGVIGPLAVKTLMDVYEKALSKLTPEDQIILEEAIRRYNRSLLEMRGKVDPSSAASKAFLEGGAGAPAISPAAVMAEMTLTKDQLVDVSRQLFDVDGVPKDLDKMSAEELAELGAKVNQALLRIINIREAVRNGRFIIGGDDVHPISRAKLQSKRAQEAERKRRLQQQKLMPRKNPEAPAVAEAAQKGLGEETSVETLSRVVQGESATGARIRQAEAQMSQEQRAALIGAGTGKEAGLGEGGLTMPPPKVAGTTIAEPLIGATSRNTILGQLTYHSDELAEIVLMLGRAGVLNSAELDKIINVINSEGQELTPELAEFVNELFTRRQYESLKRVQAIAQNINEAEVQNPFISAKLPSPQDLKKAVPNDEELAAMQHELTLGFGPSIRSKLNENGIPTPKELEDLPNKSAADRAADRILGLYNKSYLTFSGATVALSNTIALLMDYIGNFVVAAIPSGKERNLRRLLLWRTGQFFKTGFIASFGGLKGSPMTDAFMTGRSTLLSPEIDAAAKARRVEQARGRGISGALEKSEYAAAAGVQPESLATFGPRSIAFVDEIAKQTIYATEFKATFILQHLETNPNADWNTAVKLTEEAYSKFRLESFMINEATMYKKAAEKIKNLTDATGAHIYPRDAKGNMQDPLTFAAAVERQYQADVLEMSNMLGTDAPQFLIDFNNKTLNYMNYQAATLNMDGTKAGALKELIDSKGVDNKVFRTVLQTLYLFPQTAVNELFRLSDLALSPFATAAGFKKYKPDAKVRKSSFYSINELNSPDPLVRNRARGRLAVASILMAIGAVHYSRRGNETVGEATGTEIEGGEVDLPILGTKGATSSPTAAAAEKILEQRAGEFNLGPIQGLRLPIVSPLLAIGGLVGRTGRLVADSWFEKPVNDAMLSLEDPDSFKEIIADFADQVGASDFIDPVKEAINRPETGKNLAMEAVLRPIITAIGGPAFYGLLADVASPYQLRAANFSQDKIIDDSGIGVFKFLGRKGNVKRNILGQKVKSDATRDLLRTLLKVPLQSDIEINLPTRENDTTGRMKAMASLLAASGYPSPSIGKVVQDPDPLRRGASPSTVDLTTIEMTDGRTAYDHVLDLFAYGSEADVSDDPTTKKNPIAGIGGVKNETIEEYLIKRLGTPPVERVLNQPLVKGDAVNLEVKQAEEYRKLASKVLNERLNYAVRLVLDRQYKVPEGALDSGGTIRKDWLKLAKGVR